jgi:hypothetical protein
MTARTAADVVNHAAGPQGQGGLLVEHWAGRDNMGLTARVRT